MVNGISSILKVNSVDFIPQSQNTLEKTMWEKERPKVASAFGKILAQVLEKEHPSAAPQETYTYDYGTCTYDSNLTYQDFQYYRKEYTY